MPNQNELGGFLFLMLSFCAASSSQAQEAFTHELKPVSDYWDYLADWSPDGKKIVFCSTRAAHPARSLFIVDVETTAVEQLTHNEVPSGDCFPRWSPDGKQIAFTSNREGNTNIYVMESGGSGLRNLTQSPDDKGAVVDWSPDGERIVFSSDRDGDDDLYTIALDGSDVRQLTNMSGELEDPDWSPDGSRIAFSVNREGNWEIYSMAADGTDLQRLTYHWAWDGHPVWSPDGKALTFYSDRDGTWFDIYTMGADGANVRRHTRSPDIDLDPDWSPDGEKIAWHSASGRYGIEITSIDGSDHRRLTGLESSDFARLVRKDGVDAAIEAHRQAKQRQPEASFFYSGEIWKLAEERLAAGDTDGAIRLHELHVDVGTTLEYPLAYAYEGLARAYRAAGRPAPLDFFEFRNVIRMRGIEQASAMFDDASKLHPGWKVLSEFHLNRLGYQYLLRGWTEEALAILEMNAALYPDSANACDSLAEAYWRSGDRRKAMKTYEKAQKMDPDGPVGANASQMLERLLDAEETY